MCFLDICGPYLLVVNQSAKQMVAKHPQASATCRVRDFQYWIIHGQPPLHSCADHITAIWQQSVDAPYPHHSLLDGDVVRYQTPAHVVVSMIVPKEEIARIRLPLELAGRRGL